MDPQLAAARAAVEAARVARGLPANGCYPPATEPVDEPDTDDTYLDARDEPWEGQP